MANYTDIDILTIRKICEGAVRGINQAKQKKLDELDQAHAKYKAYYEALPWYRRLFKLTPIPPKDLKREGFYIPDYYWIKNYYAEKWIHLAQDLFDTVSVYKDFTNPVPTVRVQVSDFAVLVRFSNMA